MVRADSHEAAPKGVKKCLDQAGNKLQKEKPKIKIVREQQKGEHLQNY